MTSSLRPFGRWPERPGQLIETIDAHTAGEPFRIVISDDVILRGDTMLARREYARTHQDEIRKLLMLEPRGHSDMYGAFLTRPATDDGDLGVVFTHNEGYSTMCGHGIIALATALLETEMLAATPPQTHLRIDTPAGRVEAIAHHGSGRIESVAVRNVASFVADADCLVHVPGQGMLEYDLAFGGAYYALVDARPFTTPLTADHASTWAELGTTVKAAIERTRSIEHPTEPELGFLYGVIFAGEAEESGHHSRNVCVFADGEVDRSPTGTGVSARLALAHANGELTEQDEIVVESLIGTTFRGRILETTTVGSIPAVVPQITGSAFLTGLHRFWLDPADPLREGIRLR